ncbi:hypothetical protein MIB92_02040 [Aestuariirhabdus sp. Z084]|uniref:hypothetical protein n=1 Tax=Aestuariirhabdus haliotis TaxID=2918751 RepID=UPI00201B3B5D|nr:hypothetical protein [Aestuariirhabdus haliotis]MCL6414420.1 hypothetical protein [Aestuariirhabdus haliotis]MCL6418598.1 hypothetical protein [Aestuariirhabdus haliotis]
MIRLLFCTALLSLSLLSGCAQIEKQNADYPLTVNTQVIGNRITIRINSAKTGPVKQAQVTITDDIRQIVFDEPMGSSGVIRFRVPTLATKLTIIVVDAEGNKGRAILMGDQLRESEGRNRRWY